MMSWWALGALGVVLVVGSLLAIAIAVTEGGRRVDLVLRDVTEDEDIEDRRRSIHSVEDRQEKTHRLIPPPKLDHGGVVGRPRSVFLGDDGEWINNPRR